MIYLIIKKHGKLLQIGDLVTVRPAKTGLYIVVAEKSKDTVVLYGKINDDYLSLPMDKKWIDVISKG